MYEEIIARAKFLNINGNNNLRRCVSQAIQELIPTDELRDIYSSFGITIEEYIDSILDEINRG